MNEILYLYEHVDVLMIIYARVLAFMLFLPVVEEAKLPKRVIAGFSLCLSLSIYFKVDVAADYYAPYMLSFAILLIKETLVGIILGFVVKLFFQIYPFMGTLLSMQGGISMSTVMDPAAGVQSPLVGRIYNLGFIAIFLVSGGLHLLISTLVSSFDKIPIGQVLFKQAIVSTLIEAVAVYFELGLKLALPIVAVILIIDFAMGIMARTVPQMNMFVIGIPLKMLVMFILMIVTIQMVTDYNHLIISKMIQTLTEMIQGMSAL